MGLGVHKRRKAQADLNSCLWQWEEAGLESREEGKGDTALPAPTAWVGTLRRSATFSFFPKPRATRLGNCDRLLSWFPPFNTESREEGNRLSSTHNPCCFQEFRKAETRTPHPALPGLGSRTQAQDFVCVGQTVPCARSSEHQPWLCLPIHGSSRLRPPKIKDTFSQFVQRCQRCVCPDQYSSGGYPSITRP